MRIDLLMSIFLGVAFEVLPTFAQVDPQPQPAAPTASTNSVESPQVSQMVQQYEVAHNDVEDARASLTEANPRMAPLLAQERRLLNGLMEVTEDRDQAVNRYREMLDALQETRGSIEKKTGRVDVSPAGLRSAMRSLEDQRQTLVIEQAGEKARRDAIQEIISEQSAKAAVDAPNDPVTQELEQIVGNLKTELDQINTELKGSAASKFQVLDAQSALAEAEIRLAEHRKSVTASAGADSVAGFNDKLIQMTVDESEQQATLQAVNDQLTKLAAVSADIDQLERLQNRMHDAEADLRQATVDARMVERELAISPPHHAATRPAAAQPGGPR